MTRRLPHLHRQLKNDNRGASLVTVVVITSLIIVMATVLLSIVLLNYYMKRQNAESQENFYSAESAMEEIRMGLVVEVSDAATIAYTETLTNYTDLTRAEKEEAFQTKFFEEMQKRLKDGNDKEHYNCELLKSFLKTEGAKLETPQDGKSNALNDKSLEASERCLVLKGVSVSYTDEEDNYSVITTDIDIIYPDIDFSNVSSMDNILCYAIIAGEKEKTGQFTNKIKQDMSFVAKDGNKAGVDIRGNVYLGSANAMIKNTEVRFSNIGGATGYITGTNLNLDGNATVKIDGMETWLQNINIANNSTFTASNGESYLQNDLVLNGGGAKATLDGSLYAFGNPDAVRTAQCYDVNREKSDQISKALESNEADYSSSIIVNGGTGTKLDLSGIQNLMLAGTSYINTAKDYKGDVRNNQNPSVQTGQSVMTTSDQRAYLVPGELLGENPMTAETYNKLKASIMEEKEKNNDTSPIKSTDWVNFETAVPGLGKSLNELGVTGIQTSAIQVNGAEPLYYFFMKFDDQAKRNAFVRDYYNHKSHSNKLNSNISTYASGGLHMPGATSDALSFYLEGNALSSDGGLVISDTLERKTEDVLTRETNFTDMYAGMMADLNKDYQSLTESQKKKSLFDNLLDEEAINGVTEYYVSENGDGAVVTSGNISVSAADNAVKDMSVKDVNGNYHSDARITLIISKGIVTVDQNFEGLIICDQTIAITPACKEIKQDAFRTHKAFQALTEDKKCPAQYLLNKDHYEVGGTGDAQDIIKLSDYVKYSNWEKY